jgi:hypothetical protein
MRFKMANTTLLGSGGAERREAFYSTGFHQIEMGVVRPFRSQIRLCAQPSPFGLGEGAPPGGRQRTGGYLAFKG